MVRTIWVKCQAATFASIAGIQRLAKEKAFVYEVVGLSILLALFLYVGATYVHMLVLGGLGLAVFAVEAINTAIEIIVDYISPEWSEMAKQAKDLGSFAVSCMLLLIVSYATYVLV